MYDSVKSVGGHAEIGGWDEVKTLVHAVDFETGEMNEMTIIIRDWWSKGETKLCKRANCILSF